MRPPKALSLQAGELRLDWNLLAENDPLEPRDILEMELHRLKRDYFSAGPLRFGFFPSLSQSCLRFRKIQAPQPGTHNILAELFKNIHSMDLDFENLPVNRGTGLSRFSEYAPRNERKHEPTIQVSPGTTARAHFEIRPIRGVGESWLTRGGWDFTPNVYYTNTGILPALEIDGAGVVDPPTMQFDFSRGRGSVLSVDGGDYSYQNPQVSGEPLQTPFHALIDPPEQGHDYWMFRFNPIADTLVAGLMEAVSNGSWDPLITAGIGSLLLWAYLPTVGLVDPQHFKRWGIPFNTFPRRPGDLIRFLAPIFSAETRVSLKDKAPFYNPNLEYLDREGNRRPLPENPEEVREINEALHLSGFPPIPRKRGSIIDWFFTDILKDPRRLSEMKKAPEMKWHLNLQPNILKTPAGNIKIGASTDIRGSYRLVPTESGGVQSGRAELQVEIAPLHIPELDFSFGKFTIKGKDLKADKLFLVIPSVPGALPNNPANGLPWHLIVEGLELKELEVSHHTRAIEIDCDEDLRSERNNNFIVSLGKVGRAKFTYFPKANENSEGRWDLEFSEGSGQSLRWEGELGTIAANEFEIPAVQASAILTQDAVPTSIQEALRSAAIRRLEIWLSEIRTKVDLAVQLNDSKTRLELMGAPSLKNMHYVRETKDEQVVHHSTLGLSGVIESAKISHRQFGYLRFTTQEDPMHPHPINGALSHTSTRASSRPSLEPSSDFSLRLDLPFVGIDSKGIVDIPPGSSTLRDGHVKVSASPSFSLEVSGKVDLKNGSHSGTEPTEMGQFRVFPRIADIEMAGDFLFEYSTQGFRLGPKPDGQKNLQIGFDLGGSELRFRPSLDRNPIGRLPESAVIETHVFARHAKIDIADLKGAAIRRISDGEEIRNKLTFFESGPFSIHHLEGSGAIWVDLFIWGFVRGLFPVIGGGGKPAQGAQVPDPSRLFRHLNEPRRKELGTQLGGGDFFHAENLKFDSPGNGDFRFESEDLMLSLREIGGRGQFGLIQIPEFDLMRDDGGIRPSFGRGGFLLDIFLNDPERGGYFRIRR